MRFFTSFFLLLVLLMWHAPGFAGGCDGWTFYDKDNSGVYWNVNQVAPDNHGGAWVTPWTGERLVYYDGVDWIEYTDTLVNLMGPNLDFSDIFVAHNGDVLFAVYNGGIAIKKSNSWIIYNEANTNVQYLNSPQNVAQDLDGNIWVITYELIMYNGVKWDTIDTSNSPLPHQFVVQDIAVAPNGDIWIPMLYQGISKFDGIDWVWWPTDSVHSEFEPLYISFDKFGIPWVITNNSYSFTYQNNSWLPQSHPFQHAYSISQVAIDGRNHKWFDGQKLTVFNDTLWKEFDEVQDCPEFSTLSFDDIAADSNGVIWTVGSSGMAVYSGDDPFLPDTVLQIPGYSLEQSWQLSLYPNPVSDELQVAVELPLDQVASDIQIQVFNLEGQVVKSMWLFPFANASVRTSIAVGDLAEGVYLVRFRGAGWWHSERFVVE